MRYYVWFSQIRSHIIKVLERVLVRKYLTNEQNGTPGKNVIVCYM